MRQLIRTLSGAGLALLIAVPSVWALQEGEWDDPDGSTGATSKTGTLIVRVEGLESSDGKLRCVIFNSEDDFLQNAYRAEVLDIEDEVTWILDYLPYGDYAVLVHHDENADGEMERHWYGKPKEPTGNSRERNRFGPPKWDKASFSFEEPKLTLTVTVR